MNKDSKAQRITFVIGSMAVGGAETQMALLATELVRRGWDVSLYALEDGDLRSRFESGGVRVLLGGYDSSARGRARKIALIARAQWRLFTLLLRQRPHVVHAFLPLTNLMGAVAGKLARIRVVVTSRRALGLHQDRHPWWPWFDRMANACSTIVTVNSAAVGDDTVARDGIAREKLALIYNGLQFSVPDDIVGLRHRLREQLSLAADDIALVCVANLIPYKGHAELIEAFAKLRGDGANVTLCLVGDDRGIGASLAAQAQALGVTQWVKFLGRRSDVKTLLYAMDIGVMASHEEGFSNALLEKLASGLPVVATSVGGNPEALEGMPDCLLVESKNSGSLLDGLRRAVEQLPESAQRRDVRSRIVIDRYSVDATVSQHEKIYRLKLGG
ncbi:glycosyltransferase [Trinickia sp. NRRL B-1857]|uniref:glycosyltransferase n=1 Tax=Trinickia sp. NRRL B-1857 TaxID=3162879 RepID=UPI003D29FDE7